MKQYRQPTSIVDWAVWVSILIAITIATYQILSGPDPNAPPISEPNYQNMGR